MSKRTSPVSHVRFEPEPAQHLHRIAADLNAGAQASEFRRLFVDVDADARPMQRGGGRQPAHASSHNRDGEFCHLVTSQRP
jgi:hypothetical protein